MSHSDAVILESLQSGFIAHAYSLGFTVYSTSFGKRPNGGATVCWRLRFGTADVFCTIKFSELETAFIDLHVLARCVQSLNKNLVTYIEKNANTSTPPSETIVKYLSTFVT